MKFELFQVPRIVFGVGALARLPELAAGLGKRPLVIFNGRALERVEAVLAGSALGITPLRQSGEPTAADVDAATSLARAAGCDGVIGVGGGSAVDAAKAVAGLLTNGGQATDYMEVVGKGRKLAKPAAP